GQRVKRFITAAAEDGQLPKFAEMKSGFRLLDHARQHPAQHQHRQNDGNKFFHNRQKTALSHHDAPTTPRDVASAANRKSQIANRKFTRLSVSKMGSNWTGIAIPARRRPARTRNTASASRDSARPATHCRRHPDHSWPGKRFHRHTATDCSCRSTPRGLPSSANFAGERGSKNFSGCPCPDKRRDEIQPDGC